jgi:hypothetical protein
MAKGDANAAKPEKGLSQKRWPEMARFRQSLGSPVTNGCAILFMRPTRSRDGGTGRRSGLKIRRPLRSWGFDPPSRHQQNKRFRLNWPLETGEAKIVGGCFDGCWFRHLHSAYNKPAPRKLLSSLAE